MAFENEFGICTALVRVSYYEPANTYFTLTVRSECFAIAAISSVGIKHWVILPNFSLQTDRQLPSFYCSIERYEYDCFGALMEAFKPF